MVHLRNLKDAKLNTDSLVTIGVFDGVHLGHQQLIKGLVDRAHAAGRFAIAITFFPHPDKVLNYVTKRYYLTPPEKRADLMLELGVDIVITLPFDEAFRQLTAAEFVDLLVDYLRIRELWVGADFALGFQREGDVRYLQAQGVSRGFTVNAVELITTQYSDTLIRSSKVRSHVIRGEMSDANAMLGRSYELTGKVVEGERRGRTIGIPTANLQVWSEQIVPANGVYATWALLGEEAFMAATNIGQRPTFAGDHVTVEAHLLDFNRDIYGEQMELRFEKRLRPERKFNGVDELIAQIRSDIAATQLHLRAKAPN